MGVAMRGRKVGDLEYDARFTVPSAIKFRWLLQGRYVGLLYGSAIVFARRRGRCD